MRRSLVLLVALATACSGSAEVSTTSNQTTPSTTASPQTLIPGALIPADPATLVPFEDASPVVVGPSHDGVVSRNGRWAAVRTEESGDRDPLISTIDLNSLLVVSDQEGSGDGLRIGDDGAVVWFEDGQLHQLKITSEYNPIDAPPAPAYFNNTLSILPDGRIGYLTGPGEERGSVSVVVATDDETVVHEVDAIASGPISPDQPTTTDFGYLVPDVAWDAANNHAIVVSAEDDRVVVIDLETGETTEHVLDANTSSEGRIATRDSYLSPDGATLFIATAVLQMTPEGEISAVSAQQLVAVDTADWSTRLVSATADAIYPSLADTMIATTGAEVSFDGETGEERSQSPVYLIDPTTAEPLVGFEGRSGEIVDLQFSNDGAEMYVVSEGPDGTNIDIVDIASEQLAGSLGFERISLIGEAGLIAFHVSD